MGSRSRFVTGTDGIRGVARDVGYAWRTFSRAPLAALTIVVTIALGLGLVAVVFTVYNALFLRADVVRNPEELVEVVRPVGPRTNAWLPFTAQEHEVLRRETPVFADVAGLLESNRAASVSGHAVRGMLVSGNFFQVLGSGAQLGRTLTPSDDDPAGDRRVVVLSHRGWQRLVAGDPAVVGQQVRLHGVPYEIVGVMPRGFRGLRPMPADYWAPLAAAPELRESGPGVPGDELAFNLIGRLRPGVSVAAATTALNLWAERRSDLRQYGKRRFPFELQSTRGLLSNRGWRSLAFYAPLFLVFGLVLTIGCANVANLLLARGVARQRELGIRLSLGASRWRIVRQLLTESLLLALVAAACATVVARVILAAAVGIFPGTLPLDLAEMAGVALDAPATDPRVMALLFGGAVAATALFGLAPSLYATRLELVRAMRGELTQDGRPGRVRQVLIALQVSVSAVLLICAAVFLRGALAAAAVDVGVRTLDTVSIRIGDESRRPQIVQDLRAHRSVSAVAAVSPGIAQITPFTEVEAVPDTSGEPAAAAVAEYQFVSAGYFDVLGIRLLAGRAFTPAERSLDAGVAVVSERTARRLWNDRNPLGRTIRMQVTAPSASAPQAPASKARTYTVIGITRQVGGARSVFGTVFGDGIYLPADAESPAASLAVRVLGDPELARDVLQRDLERSGHGAIQIATLRRLTGLDRAMLWAAFALAVGLAATALMLTVSGLFSAMSYLVEQRTQEIGVRMALGATRQRVARLVLKETATAVAGGLAIGVALAAALATVLLSTPAAAGIGRLVRVSDPVPYATVVLLIVAACLLAGLVPVVRAARVDPAVTLRAE